VGYCSVANGKNQEDAFSYNSIKGREFYGVYDGHGGSQVACHLKDNLHKYFAEGLVSQKIKKEAFESAFKYAEQDVLKKTESGSTAVAVYVGKKNMHIAWVGDTHAMVVEDNGNICFVTKDHDLENKDEWDRVCTAEGLIFREINIAFGHGKWRINGLEMTRSIGDQWCKGKNYDKPIKTFSQPNRYIKGIPIYAQQWPDTMLPNQWKLTPLEGQVIADPEYAQVSLNKTNRWLILATDGLWNFVDNEQAGNLIKANENNSVGSLAKILVQAALDKGSKDNVTALVIDLWSRKNK
jgi:serine/threonine protein phosphatase PrpC